MEQTSSQYDNKLRTVEDACKRQIGNYDQKISGQEKKGIFACVLTFKVLMYLYDFVVREKYCYVMTNGIIYLYKFTSYE